jgi:hypothetical protein
MDTELLLTMLINMQYLQIKALTQLTEDKETLEQATMIVKESQNLLARIMKEDSEEYISNGINVNQQDQVRKKKKLWRL